MLNIEFLLQLFVLLDPLASFPFLIAAYGKKMNVQIIALKATLTAFIIAVCMALAGPVLFEIFGISLNSFRIAGGIVLLILGYQLLRPEDKKDHEVRNIDALTTLIATPMLTGPGVISFITIKTFEFGRIQILPDIVLAFVLVGAVFFIFSLLVSKIEAKIVNILSRILGLFLMAMAIEMIAVGIKGFF
ncbi:MAG: MarC family protein [archaeon]